MVGSERSSVLSLRLASRRARVIASAGAGTARLARVVASAGAGTARLATVVVVSARRLSRAARGLAGSILALAKRHSPIPAIAVATAEFRGTRQASSALRSSPRFGHPHCRAPHPGQGCRNCLRDPACRRPPAGAPTAIQALHPTLLLSGAYVGLSAWIFINSAVWGCNCEGKASGFYEFAAIGVLALVAIGVEPKLRGPALIGTLCGLALAAGLALGGVGSLNSGTVDLTQTGGGSQEPSERQRTRVCRRPGRPNRPRLWTATDWIGKVALAATSWCSG